MHSKSKKVAAIAGATGGIGSSCARLFASNGFDLVIMGRNEQRLKDLEVELSESSTNVISATVDVRDLEALMHIGQYVKQEHGKVDVLVNCAGGQFFQMAKDMNEHGWRAVLETNLFGAFYLAKSFFELLLASHGSIVNVVANIYDKPAMGLSHSSAARAGVVNLTKALALEWARYGIRVNAVSPGVTLTDGLKAMTGANIQDLISRVPLGRAASADEIARIIYFLASDAAAYITGAVVVADGGLGLL